MTRERVDTNYGDEGVYATYYNDGLSGSSNTASSGQENIIIIK